MSTTTKGLDVRGAQVKYSIQNIVIQAAFCPVTMTSTFLLGRGISSSMVGVMSLVGNLLAILIQPSLAKMGDSRRGPTVAQMLLALSGLTAASFAAALLSNFDVLTILFAAMVYMFDMNVITLANSVSVYYENRGANMNYGVARGLGSAAYAATSPVLGMLITSQGSDSICLLGLVLCCVMAATMLLLPTPKDVEAISESAEAVADENSGDDGSYISFLKTHPKLLLVVLGCAMCFVLENAFGTYAITIVESCGGNATDMGWMLALQAILELPGMFGYKWLEKRFKTSSLLMFSLVGYLLKGVAFCFATSVPMLFAAYGFQMISFAIWMPASVSYANKFFAESDKNKAVGLMAMAMPLSGAFGNFISGILIDAVGLHSMIVAVTLIAVVGVICGKLGIEHEKESAQQVA